MYYPGHAVPPLRLDLHHQTLGAHRDDLILKSLLPGRRPDDAL